MHTNQRIEKLIGTKVEVLGTHGMVEDITDVSITIKTKDGHIKVPVKAWGKTKFLTQPLHNRRKEDKGN